MPDCDACIRGYTHDTLFPFGSDNCQANTRSIVLMRSSEIAGPKSGLRPRVAIDFTQWLPRRIHAHRVWLHATLVNEPLPEKE